MVKIMEINTGIDIQDRRLIAEGLCTLLADTYLLYLKTHHFHWNVTGPMFLPLHTLFEQQYQELAVAIDVIAERIRSLGFPAPGTFQEFQQLTKIEETPGVPAAEIMVKLLVEAHETVGKTAREAFPVVNNVQDEATADLLTQRLQVHEKASWMLRSIIAG